MKLRSHFVLLVSVTLLPVVIFSTIVLHMMLASERAAALRSMQELARASVNAMDREMTVAMATAQALSTSRNLNEGNFRAFYDQAAATNRGRAVYAALLDENGQQLFNTVRPFGSAIPVPNDLGRDRIRAVIAGGKPVYSDLIRGRATGQFIVGVEVPVTIRSGQRVVVDEWLFASHLNEILPIKNIPASWLIAVFDKRGVTVARNRNPEQFVGSPPRPERHRTILEGFEGVSRAYTRDGIEMYGAWQRSSVTGWSAGVGVPVDEIEKTAVQSVALTAAGFVIAIVFAVGGAGLLSRRLVGAIAKASASAEVLAQHEVPALADLRVEEMNRLQMALHRAGKMLVAGEAVKREVLEEAKRARHHAEEAQKIAEDQNRAKDEFLAMLGHELRNPLAAIASGVTMLDMPGSTDDRATKVKAIIRRQTQHLTHLVDELLDAHRILHGKITLARVQTDLKGAVEACVASFEARGAARTHRLELDLAEATISADPTRLEQMICNLIDNALKYTPEGGRIKVSLRTASGVAVFEVADNGIGLPPDMLTKVFDVFVQGRVVNRAKGGLGIGLAVVNALALQHGAILEAHSPGINRGSVFTLRFPVLEGAGRQDLPAVVEPGSGQARILVIEDNADVREMMFLMLSEHGFTVDVASNGTSGIESATTRLPDIALVDIDLPDMSGYDIAARLREAPRTAGIGLVAVTGYGQASDREKALAAGFDDHIAKPAPIEVLVETIHRLKRQAIM